MCTRTTQVTGNIHDNDDIVRATQVLQAYCTGHIYAPHFFG